MTNSFLSRKAKLLIDEVKSCRNKEDLKKSALTFAESLGFPRFIYAISGPEVAYGNYPDAWLDEYIKNNDKYHDPVINQMLHRRYAVDWSLHQGKIFNKRTLDHIEKRVIENRWDHGLRGGITAPVFGGGKQAEWGVLSLTSDAIIPTDVLIDLAPQVQLYAVYYHAVATRIFMPSQNTQSERFVLLTPRERACLAHASTGKTQEQIADFIKISKGTVKFHMANACSKLSAENSKEAIALALSVGLIPPV